VEAAGVEPGHHASYQELTAFRFLLIRSIRSNGPVDTRIAHTDGPPTRLSSLVRLESGNSTALFKSNRVESPRKSGSRSWHPGRSV
jgi:hypothetical protein